MKKIIVYAVMIFFAFLFQSSFFSHFTLAGMVPNILMILTAAIGIIEGQLEGCLVGFFSGLLFDLVFGPYIGVSALGYMFCGYLAGTTSRTFYKEDITSPVLMITAVDVVYGLYFYIVGFMIRGRLDILFYIRRIILPEAAYTVIIAIFLYRFILFVCEHLQRKGSEKLIA